MGEIIRTNDGSTIIMNGGANFGDYPKDWDEARKLMDAMNERCPFEEIKWSFDCGFKLDYDGSILRINSRFYPPAQYYGAGWDGRLTIYVFDEMVKSFEFKTNTLPELEDAVYKKTKQIFDFFTRKMDGFFDELK